MTRGKTANELVDRLRNAARNGVLPQSARNLMTDAADELESLTSLFDRRWDADMRGIKRWQAAGPGRKLTWPDHAELIVFLLEQLEAKP